MRTIVTIRTVKDITPIPNADRIELAHIDGWKCVVGKNQLKIGEKCVYFEIDTFLPKDRFPFLKNSIVYNGVEGAVLRTARFKGQISQGLVLPTTDFPGVLEHTGDLAEYLSVTLYEEPIPKELIGTAIGMFPTYLRKTDLERIQNVPETLQDRETVWDVTMKMDGQSCTIYHYDGKFGVCQKAVDLKEDPNNPFWKVAMQHNLPQTLSQYGNIAIQGELLGGSRNVENVPLSLMVFNVFSIDDRNSLNSADRKNVAGQLGLHQVPTVASGTFNDLGLNTIDDVLAFAEGPGLNRKHREGVVFRAQNDGNIAFKVIANSLLK